MARPKKEVTPLSKAEVKERKAKLTAELKNAKKQQADAEAQLKREAGAHDNNIAAAKKDLAAATKLHDKRVKDSAKAFEAKKKELSKIVAAAQTGVSRLSAQLESIGAAKAAVQLSPAASTVAA